MLNTRLFPLIKKTNYLALGMPNKRHPTRRFIGFWATGYLKDQLRKHAIKKRMTLSFLIAKILLDFLKNEVVEVFVVSATLLLEIC